jgi:chromosome segregation ATPase
MGYRSQTSSRRASAKKYPKSAHEKAKPKTKKRKSTGKFVEETPKPTLKEVVEKTLSSLENLGNQTFALSPFSQYYDDWLVNLKQSISEFESRSDVGVDEDFVNERNKIFTDVERALAERRIKEAEMEAYSKAISENNHLIVDTDAEYAAQTRELSQKRNSDIERLTKKLNDAETELEEVKKMKTSLIFGFTKKAKAKKEEEIAQKINSVKSELELAVQNFAVEQEKLHDEYQKKKQDIIQKVKILEKEIAEAEVDTSIEARKDATKALANAVNALAEKKSESPKSP